MGEVISLETLRLVLAQKDMIEKLVEHVDVLCGSCLTNS
ncbi:Uncharacterised protein [Pandoraea pulmonicola]|uniref:Uncharacterized protein n=1 Tax=Pandoraea pulmonicola TaxID=93221 RepID=A0AAJ4Z9G4_PANPU|nr:Uncharacterised protein [Pandoraea pulmonicola]